MFIAVRRKRVLSSVGTTYFYVVPTELVKIEYDLSYKHSVPKKLLNFQIVSKKTLIPKILSN